MPYPKSLNILVCCLILQALASWTSAQVGDTTITLTPTEVLTTADSVYFGVNDTLVILPKEIKFRIDEYSPKRLELIKSNYFRFVQSDLSPQELDQIAEKTRIQFEPYAGRIIRNIRIKQVDISEGSVEDTTLIATTDFGVFLNKAHFKTKPWILKQYFRFKENRPISPDILAENERLLRSLPFLQDAKIHVHSYDVQSDSVDIIVITQDNFPIGFGGYFSSFKNFGIDPFTRNFLGLGHTIAARFIWKADEGQRLATAASYKIVNIFGSFTNMEFMVENMNDWDKYQFRITKPFATNDTRIGGEIDIHQVSTTLYWSEEMGDSIYRHADPFKKNVADIWYGHAFFPEKGNYNRNISAGINYKTESYIRRPTTDADSNLVFHNQNTYLGSLSYSNFEYYKTNRMLGFGITEDAPLGLYAKLTFGKQQNKYFTRPYGGIIFAVANHYPRFGYLTFNAGIGSFFYNGNSQDIKLGARIAYYSPLTGSGRFQLRHFVVPSFESYSNPKYLRQDNFGDRIRGLRQDFVFGASSLVLRYEAVLFTPYSLVGFKLSASGFTDAGWISKFDMMTGSKEFYSVIGLALNIKNESLTIPTFSVQLGFYPKFDNERNKLKVTFRFSDRLLFPRMLSIKPTVYFN